MINALEIIGYQSHMETIMELHPGINYIIGESDIGKSAIIRAIRWLFRNLPRGDGFRNWDLKANEVVRVACEFTDESWVAREKGNLHNIYQISTEEDDLKALRTGVPPEVLDLTHITDINIQRQQSWFLLDEKPGAVAKKFNELANLSIMDSATKVANTRIRDANSKKKVLEDRRDKKLKKLEELNKWFEPAEKDLKVILLQEEKCKKLIDRETRLVEICNQLQSVNEKLERYKHLPAAEKALAKLQSAFQTFEQQRKRRDTLRRLTESIGTVRSKLKTYADIDKIEKQLIKLLRLQEEIDLLREQGRWISTKVDQITQIDSKLVNLDNFIEKTEKVIQGKLKQLGTCPTCGQKIGDHKCS